MPKNFKSAVTSKDWKSAFIHLNGLSMYDMLRALAELSAATLNALIAQRFVLTSVNMGRMEYAWTIVKTREFPLVAPSDLLKTGQVQDAALWLKKPAPSAPRVTLNLTVFIDSIVDVAKHARVELLTRRAQEILGWQGGGFRLDVRIHPAVIPFKEKLTPAAMAEMFALVEKTTPVPASRLPVLVGTFLSGQLNGETSPPPGRRVVAINADNLAADRATLLHEMGHAAGLPHSREPREGESMPVDVGDMWNVMQSEVPNRHTLTVTQGEILARSAFATK
jgi:hypothetical protein